MQDPSPRSHLEPIPMATGQRGRDEPRRLLRAALGTGERCASCVGTSYECPREPLPGSDVTAVALASSSSELDNTRGYRRMRTARGWGDAMPLRACDLERRIK